MEYFNQFIGPSIGFLLGLVTKYIFDIYTKKISKVRYSINKSFLGISGEDNRFGKVQIIYNDNIPVKNLYLTWVRHKKINKEIKKNGLKCYK